MIHYYSYYIIHRFRDCLVYVYDKFTQAQKCYFGIFDNAFYAMVAKDRSRVNAKERKREMAVK